MNESKVIQYLIDYTVYKAYCKKQITVNLSVLYATDLIIDFWYTGNVYSCNSRYGIDMKS